MVKDINASGDGDPSNLEVVGSTLFFQADDGISGYELWAYDARSAQTISFADLDDRAYSVSPFTVIASSNSTLTVTMSSSTPSVCTVSGFTVTMLTTGTCTLVASQAGDGSYLAATAVTRSFLITAESTPTTVPSAVDVSSAPSLSVINSLPSASLSTSPLFVGGKITVTYSGFTPGETVQLIVASTPRVIGAGVANETGSVTVSGTIPSNIGVGQHTVAVYAPISGLGFRQIVTISAPTLPSTGSNSTSPLEVGVLLLLGGVVLMAIRRRTSLRIQPKR